MAWGHRSGALAQPRRLAVIPVATAGAPESAAELLRAATSAVDSGFTVIGDGVDLARGARRNGAVPMARLSAMAQVMDAAAEGWRAYLQVAIPFAASRLSKARSDAESSLMLPGGIELYADLSLRLGAVLLSLGRLEEADDAMALALALDPQRDVSLVEFSPDIVDAVDRARRRQVESHPVVITTPGVVGAAIEIDGEPVSSSAAGQPAPRRSALAIGNLSGDRRSASLRLSLPRGQHVVVARHPGYESVAQAIRVDGTATEVALTMVVDRVATALAGAVAGMSDELAGALVEGVFGYAEVDDVLLIAVSSRGRAPAVLAQRCGASLRCTAVVEVGYERPALDAALRAAWQALVRGELRYPPSLPSDSRLVPARAVAGEGKCRLCRSPWLWVGVGTATAVTTAVLIFTLGRDAPSPVLTVDPDDFVRRR
jgi:hypothetical protein